MPEYRLRVNGELRTVTVDADTPLLWVLRDELGLTGTKFGCGGGFCRACAVHVDGAPAFSCRMRIDELGERRVTTIEGLSADRSHPLQRAWIAEDVPQCGYCQSGQIMSAAALLARNPDPSADEIDTWMSPNLCRCGTYNRIRRAIQRAARAGKSDGGPSDA
jgi:aerobic-type carbon monoxide dehydrogenase small subunit (CoxS/CutS family)